MHDGLRYGWLALGLAAWLSAALLAAPPQRLSETGLYADAPGKTLAPGILSYSPQYPLWSDGALKRRYLQLPEGTTIDTRHWDRWAFPIGTKLWKEFAFTDPSAPAGQRRVETRLMMKLTEREWSFASYRWSADESDAVLVADEGAANVHATGTSTSHDIPSVAQCQLCHRRGGDPVLGFEAIQLSDDRDPGAPHAESPSAADLTLGKLIRENKLSKVPASVNEAAPRFHATSPEGRSALGYLHANCGSCHNPYGTAAHTGLEFRYVSETASAEEEPGFLTAVNRFTNVFQLPGETRSYQILAGEPARSAVLWRMKRSGEGRMPQIATEVVDASTVELIERWIRSMAPSSPERGAD